MDTATQMPPVRTRNRPSETVDVLWGTAAIGAALGITKRQAEYLCTTGALPARKVGSRWCISRKRLREFFESD
jgi:hypothetical protein